MGNNMLLSLRAGTLTREVSKTGSTKYEGPRRWFRRQARSWFSSFANSEQQSGATHEERFRKHLAPYVRACGGRNRWCRNSVSGGAGVDGCPAECQHDRPQEEPDGEPDRSSAQVLRGVERRCRGRR